MRYAIISDLHAHAAALRAVLADARDAGAEKVICLGDVLGYGDDPVETLTLVHDRVHVCLAGNHDDAVCGRRTAEDFTEVAAAAVERHRRALAPAALAWLRTLPHVCEYDGFACAHGEFSNPEAFEYVVEAEDAMPSLAVRPEPLLFVGHVHRAGLVVLGASGEPHALPAGDFVLEPGKRYVVNPGSVGLPRGGARRSSYCLYDDVERAVRFRTLPLDLDAAGPALRAAEEFAQKRPPRVRPRHRARPVSASSVSSVSVAPVVLPSARSNFGVALFLGLAALAAAGVFATVTFVRALKERPPGERVAAVAVETREPPAPVPAPASQFAEPVPLCADWSAAFERPSAQRVAVDHNARRGVTALRLENEAFATTRLVKRLSLFARPEKVHWSVRLLTTSGVGEKEPFRFTVHVRFLDEKGGLVDEACADAKRSSTGSAPVPPGAAMAEATVDCRFRGKAELAVPHFKDEPERKAQRQRSDRKKGSN